MLTLFAYLGYVRGGKRGQAPFAGTALRRAPTSALVVAQKVPDPFSLRYLAVLACFIASLAAKPMAVTLPFLLLLLDYWPLGGCRRKDGERGREGEGETTETDALQQNLPLSPSPHLPTLVWRVIWEKVPMLAIACLFCLVNVHGQGHALDINESYSFGWRMGNALISYVAYLGQSVCPAGLAPIYPRRPSFLSPWQIGGAILVLAAITAATSACWRKRPWLLVGWLWYAGMLVPVIGLVQLAPRRRPIAIPTCRRSD